MQVRSKCTKKALNLSSSVINSKLAQIRPYMQAGRMHTTKKINWRGDRGIRCMPLAKGLLKTSTPGGKRVQVAINFASGAAVLVIALEISHPV